MIDLYISGLNDFQDKAGELVEVTKVANKNNKSLLGSNFYGEKFRSLELEITISRTTLERLIEYLDDIPESIISQIRELIEHICSPRTNYKDRRDALHKFKIIVQNSLLPSLNSAEHSLPKSQQILPMAVVKDTRGYIEQIVLQFNGCYENGWYDACAVMMRKLVEILIIACYEQSNRANEIKNNGNFLMLRDLIDKIINDSNFNLGRETKNALPDIKSLGDRSAHTRRYISKKQDVDKVVKGFRITIDELLHLAGYK